MRKSEAGATAPDTRSSGEPIRLATAEAPLTAESPGRYEVRREHGRGGQAVVYLVRDAHIGRDVALKQLLPHRQVGEDEHGRPQLTTAALRFLREARITGQLEHPSIVPVYELGRRPDGTFYYTQKLVRGRTLFDAIEACKGIADRLALLSHFVDVCQALAYAHERGVIHRDIKPDNVMVGEFGETVVLDWGLAKVRAHAELRGSSDVAPAPPEELSATATGTIIGTPLYMSPEQAAGKLDLVDERSDVWSLGAMLYEILAGRPPFLGESAPAVLLQVVNDPVEPVRKHCPEAPPELTAVAERALQRDPSLRYGNARELAAEIEAWQSGSRVLAYDYSSWELARKFVAKNRLATAAAAAALAVLLAASIAVLRAHREAVGYLADALQGKARAAARESRWGDAEALWAASRVQQERTESRWGEAFARGLSPLPLRRAIGHAAGVHGVVFSADGRRAITPSSDGTIAIWDAAAWAPVAHLRGHAGSVEAAALSPDGRTAASVGKDGTLRLWDLEARAPLATLGPWAKGLEAVAFSPDGRTLAVAGGDAVVRLVDPAARSVVRELRGHQRRVRALAFARDGRLFSAGEDGTVRQWAPDGAEVARWDQRPLKIRALAVAADGRTLAVGGSGGSLRLLRPGQEDPTLVLEGHDRVVGAVAFSPDARLLASASWSGSVAVWDVASGRPLSRFSSSDQAALGLSFTPDGRALATVHHVPSLRLWALPAQPLASFPGAGGAVRALAFADAAHLLAGSHDGSAPLLDLQARALRKLLAPGEPNRAVAVSRDRARAAVAGDAAQIELFALPGGAPLRSLPTAPGVVALAFSPGGERLLAAGPTTALAIWDLAAGRVSRTLGPVQSRANAVAWSPDGALLATAHDDAVRLWDAATGAARGELKRHTSRVRSLDFSPDGRLLASGSNDRTVILWDVAARQPRVQLEAHDGPVRALAFSPDGEALATGGADSAVRVWEVATGQRVLSSVRHTGEVMSLAFSPDGQLLASGGADKLVELLPLGDRRALPGPAESLARALQRHWLRMARLELEESPPPLRDGPAALVPIEADEQER